MIDTKTDHIEQILKDPKGMLGIFKGLERFDITDYEKVAARVQSEHLDFFVAHYLAQLDVSVKRNPDGLLSFEVPKRLVEIGTRLANNDIYAARSKLKVERIDGATPDKELAQKTLNSRLLRFGDPVFEAMVAHVQHAGFSDGVAHIELPSAVLKWSKGDEGTWLLYDVRIVREQTSLGGMRVLRHELVSLLVPKGAESATIEDGVVEAAHDAGDASGNIDAAEARRAYELGRATADKRLGELFDEVVAEFGKADGILPQRPQDVGLAWVRAV